jgi:uncharacterized protein YprB with RNaseH-like and TPR domain
MLVESWGLFNQNHHIGQIVEPSEMVSFAAVVVGAEDRILFRSVYHDTKTKMLNDVWLVLHEADELVTFNGKGFDCKHLKTELMLAGFAPPSPWKDIDLLPFARKHFKLDSNKLDYISQATKIGKKLDYGESHSELLRGCAVGEQESLDKLRDYNIQDAMLNVHLYELWKESRWGQEWLR